MGATVAERPASKGWYSSVAFPSFEAGDRNQSPFLPSVHVALLAVDFRTRASPVSDRA